MSALRKLQADQFMVPAIPLPLISKEALEPNEDVTRIQQTLFKKLSAELDIEYLDKGIILDCTTYPLGFYEDALLFEWAILKSNSDIGVLSAIADDKGICHINGQSNAIHSYNHIKGLDLSSKANAFDYLQFFCRSLTGEDGVFTLITDLKELDRFVLSNSDISNLPSQIVREHLNIDTYEIQIVPANEEAPAEDKPDKLWEAKAIINYSGVLFETKLSILSNGFIEMTDDNPLKLDLKLNSERFDNGMRTMVVR